MNQNQYSKISFYCSIVIVLLIPIVFAVIFIIPTPSACDSMADLFVLLSGLIGSIGLLFSIIGIRENNSTKKWFGVITNLFFVILAILDISSR